LEGIYSRIFIDELQDLAGYDLEILDRLFRSRVGVLAVGDPRQGTFSTNQNAKHKQFKRGGILEWLSAKQKEGIFVMEERTVCHRSNQAICDFADQLFPAMPKTTSENREVTGHDDVVCLKANEVAGYVEKYRPAMLRYDKRADTMGYCAANIGTTKGKTFDRVLIFPTKPMKAYLKSKDVTEAGDLSKFYVAVTRARYSVAFVV
jgi:DNA helicase-2/ATP-dependent DNA helicase PcrA